MDNFTDRLIRVFISSTFCDLFEEREYLIKRIFPNLINMAEKRYVTLVPIDLRWGITHDQAEELSYSSKVINSCLNEIDKCKPFFIGIVGQNYGWCPLAKEIDDACVPNFCNWIKESLDGNMSITELEMQYAVWRNNHPTYAGFYIKNCIAEEGSSIQLDRLKHTIKKNAKHKNYIVKEFDSKEELGQQISEDFRRLLDTLYPEDDCSPMQYLQNEQKIFIRSRTRLYISVGDTLSLLNSFLREEQNLLAIISESGMGKSALIANWLSKVINERNLRTVFFFAFNGKDKKHCDNVLDYLIKEICNCYQLPMPNTFTESDMTFSQAFVNILHSIPDNKPLLIVIDGINQILGEEDPQLLNWLPWVLPRHIHLLLTSTPENTIIKSLKKRKYRLVKLYPMQKDDLHLFIEQYLLQYGKHLSHSHLTHILNQKKFQNTLVVKTLLDELITFGQFDQLNEQINRYICANNIEEFFQQVLLRIENDFQDLPIKRILASIVFSKNGMSEIELQGIFSEIQPLCWSQFYSSISNNIITQNGRIIFSHQMFSEAASRRYRNIEKEVRESIVDFFTKRESPRAYDELAHQYYSLGQLYDLYLMLKKIDVFEHFYTTDERLLYSYWNTMKHDDLLINMSEYGKEKYRGFCCFQEIIPTSIDQARIFYHLGLFYEKYFEHDISCFGPPIYFDRIALDFFDRAVRTMLFLGYENHPDTARFQISLGLKYMHIREYDLASLYTQRGFDILGKCAENETNLDLARFYSMFGRALMEKENLKKKSDSYHTEPYDITSAMKYYEMAYELYKNLYGEDHPIIAQALCLIGAAHVNVKSFDRALDYVGMAIEIQEKYLSDKDIDLAKSYELLGRVYLSISNHLEEKNIIQKMILEDLYVELSYEYHVKARQILIENLGSDHHSVLDMDVFIFNSISGHFLSAAEDFLDEWRDLIRKNYRESASECARLSLCYYAKYSNLSGHSVENNKSVMELNDFLLRYKNELSHVTHKL